MGGGHPIALALDSRLKRSDVTDLSFQFPRYTLTALIDHSLTSKLLEMSGEKNR